MSDALTSLDGCLIEDVDLCINARGGKPAESIFPSYLGIFEIFPIPASAKQPVFQRSVMPDAGAGFPR